MIACVTTHFIYNTTSLKQPQIFSICKSLTNSNEKHRLIQTVFQSQDDRIDDLETYLFYSIDDILDRSKILLNRNLKVNYLLLIWINFALLILQQHQVPQFPWQCCFWGGLLFNGYKVSVNTKWVKFKDMLYNIVPVN